MEERVLVKEDHVNNETTYYVDENYVRVINTSGSYDFTYVKHEGQLIAQKNPDSSKIYIHPDHLGSVSVVTNQSGDILETSEYSPFGEILDGGETTKYQYESKEFDSVVGDYDFHFRKYKSEWGLFTQPDSIISNVYNPQALNRYSFELNNPYSRIDPDGHIAPLLAAMGIGALIGAGAGLATYFITHALTDKQYTFKGALAYTLGGAAAGALAPLGASIFGYGTSATAIAGAGLTSAVGGGLSQIAMNVGEDQPWDTNVGSAMVIGGISGGIGQKYLPMARTWLIKHASSYLSTGTGQTFALNRIKSEGLNYLANSLYNYYTSQADQTKNDGRGGSGGGRTAAEASSAWWGGLGAYAEANSDQTAGEIINAWKAATGTSDE